MAEKDLTHVQDNNFEVEILKSDIPVVVDFWAAWCGPCHAIAPILEDLAGQYSGKLKVAKCNVDQNPVTPSKYGIRAIPTLIFFKDGKVFDQITGVVSKGSIESTINRMLS